MLSAASAAGSAIMTGVRPRPAFSAASRSATLSPCCGMESVNFGIRCFASSWIGSSKVYLFRIIPMVAR